MLVITLHKLWSLTTCMYEFLCWQFSVPWQKATNNLFSLSSSISFDKSFQSSHVSVSLLIKQQDNCHWLVFVTDCPCMSASFKSSHVIYVWYTPNIDNTLLLLLSIIIISLQFTSFLVLLRDSNLLGLSLFGQCFEPNRLLPQCFKLLSLLARVQQLTTEKSAFSIHYTHTHTSTWGVIIVSISITNTHWHTYTTRGLLLYLLSTHNSLNDSQCWHLSRILTLVWGPRGEKTAPMLSPTCL